MSSQKQSEKKCEWDFEDITAPKNCILFINEKGERKWKLSFQPEKKFIVTKYKNEPAKVTEYSSQPPVSEWDYGNLTFDEIKDILNALCNAKYVNVLANSLVISFAPKSVTGKVLENSREKMLRIIKKLSENPKSIDG
jgi:hypothetical protein